MAQDNPAGSGIRFLVFANDKEDAEKEAKLKEAASKIEAAIAKSKALDELVDYVPPNEQDDGQDPADDTRPLYERLLEQRTKKQEEAEQSSKLSNLVSKLDEDDVNYLNDVARMKQEDEIKRRLEIYDVLEEKKLQIQKRNLEEDERKRKELLSGSIKTAANKSKSSLKSKLSSIKIRPKSGGQNTSSTSEISRPKQEKRPSLQKSIANDQSKSEENPEYLDKRPRIESAVTSSTEQEVDLGSEAR